jgi:hypothetical protein
LLIVWRQSNHIFELDSLLFNLNSAIAIVHACHYISLFSVSNCNLIVIFVYEFIIFQLFFIHTISDLLYHILFDFLLLKCVTEHVSFLWYLHDLEIGLILWGGVCHYQDLFGLKIIYESGKYYLFILIFMGC